MKLRRRHRAQVVRPPAPSGGTGACGAPHASMYFAPDGQVRACCVNTEYTLGRIGEQSIREIWDGSRMRALRQALDGHNYSLGCQDCEHRIAAGDREWSTAAQYDPYLHDEPGEFPRRMDFILSITCNLQCAMCDGDLSSSIRLHREKRPPLPPAYGDAFFDELREFLPHLERSVFLGGEPFVAREPQRVWDLMIDQGLDAPVQVITNGTQWNAKVQRYLRELPMSITVSADGITAGTLESLRVGVDRDRLFANVDRYQEAVAGNGGTVSFHYCLMRQNWHEFGRFLEESDRRGVHTLVMTVTGPAGFSLWDLPSSELREVLVALEREDEELAPGLGLNRPVWDAELDRIRRHLALVEDGPVPAWVRTSAEPTAVAVGVPRSASVPDADDELLRWSGREPLVVEAVDGVITSVRGAAWADHLSPQSWVGVELDRLTDRVAASLGAASEPELEVRADGVVASETVFGSGRDAVRFRAVACPGPSGRLRVALAVEDPDLSVPM